MQRKESLWDWTRDLKWPQAFVCICGKQLGTRNIAATHVTRGHREGERARVKKLLRAHHDKYQVRVLAPAQAAVALYVPRATSPAAVAKELRPAELSPPPRAAKRRRREPRRQPQKPTVEQVEYDRALAQALAASRQTERNRRSDVRAER